MKTKTVSVAGVTLAVLLVFTYGLNRGIYVGKRSYIDGETLRDGSHLIRETCRYLFITGVSELPAKGNALEQYPMFRGVRFSNQADNLYCRVFAN